MFLPIRVFFGRMYRNAHRIISRVYIDLSSVRTSRTMQRLGSAANGWYAPQDMPNGARCYCVGVGLDASFDFALAERGAEVYSFDPTPHAISYMDRVNSGQVDFLPWGLLDTDSSMRLYFPLSADHGSYFAEDLHKTGKYHEVPCYRLCTIVEKLGHESIYLMKIDIEGSWYQALLDIVQTGPLPNFLEVEFDSPAPIWRVAPVMRKLHSKGYRLILREKDNVILERITEEA